MKPLSLQLGLFGLLSLLGCSPTAPAPAPSHLGTQQSAIAYGSADSAHTAVISLLINAGGGAFGECSGTIVQVKNNSAYVLTAAHCCNMNPPSVVAMTNDYSGCEQYLVGGAPQPPCFAVTAGSVWYDPLFNPGSAMPHDDFCMFKFSAPSGTPFIPVPQPGQDGLALGTQLEHVGFGITDTSTNNSTRRTGTAPVDQYLDANILVSSQGGASMIPGTCEGDSGGPALTPAGAPQSQQLVVGTTSAGNNANCAMNTLSSDMRVTSAVGPNLFITNFLNDTPTGTQSGMGGMTCQTCQTNAQSGACASQTTACSNDSNCTTLLNCLNACTTQPCQTNCETTAGQTAVNELNAFATCICTVACATPCASQCGNPTPDAGTPDAGPPPPPDAGPQHHTVYIPAATETGPQAGCAAMPGGALALLALLTALRRRAR